MLFSPLKLSPKLSRVSWFFIELFFLLGVLALPFSKSVMEISFLIALTLWALRKFPYNEPFPSIRFLGIFYALFLAFSVLSLFNTPAAFLPTGLRGVFKWVKFLGLFWMSFEFFKDSQRARRFLGTAGLLLGLVYADGIYQLLTGADFVKKYSVDIPGRFFRLRGPFGSPNDLASFLILGLPVLFAVWIQNTKWNLKSLTQSALLILSGVALFMTLSRSAFFALFLAAAFFMLWRHPKKIAGAALLTAVLGIILAFSPILRSNFFGSLNLRDITIGERFRFWKITWDMILAHPWLGHGTNSFFRNFSSFAPASESFRGYAHNCYLQMWSEIGLFGTLFFLAPLMSLLKRPSVNADNRNSVLQQGLWVGLTAFLLQSFLDTNFYALQAATSFWVLWGAYFALGIDCSDQRIPLRSSFKG